MHDFVHLHVHSQYSILDGQASIQRLVDKAMADGMKGMALTDHGNMFSVKEFYNYVNKKNGKVKDETRDSRSASLPWRAARRPQTIRRKKWLPARQR